MQNTDKPHHIEYRNIKKDGTALLSRQGLRLSENELHQKVVLIVSEDIAKTQALSEKLTYHQTHDTLTGLVNRSEFETLIKSCIESTRNAKAEHNVVYIDLDQFKVINDTCGHIAGDELLRQIANLIKNVVRKSDTVARLGGDEFGILLQDCPLKQAQKTAKHLKQTIEDLSYTWEEKNFSISACIGIVTINEHSKNTANILNMSEVACFIAKDAGRNRIQIYNESDSGRCQDSCRSYSFT